MKKALLLLVFPLFLSYAGEAVKVPENQIKSLEREQKEANIVVQNTLKNEMLFYTFILADRIANVLLDCGKKPAYELGLFIKKEAELMAKSYVEKRLLDAYNIGVNLLRALADRKTAKWVVKCIKAMKSGGEKWQNNPKEAK